MTKRFRSCDELSSWRRISLHMWDMPADPTVYGNLEIDMRRALQYLELVNASASGHPPEPRVTVTHLVAKAIAKALAAHPEANAIIARRRIYLRDDVDVYCQVATEGGNDLSGVKVANADRKSVVDIAGELAARVEGVRKHTDPGSERSKRIVARMPHRLLGPMMKLIGFLSYDLRLDLTRLGFEHDQFGSAMVSNVGSFGAGHGLAPLVPASRVPIVLLVGRVADKPIVDDGRVVAAPCMTIGCTFDHRLIDGYQASAMAKIVVESMEDPFIAFGLPTRSSSTDVRFVTDWTGTSDTDRTGTEYTARRPGFVREEDRRSRG